LPLLDPLKPLLKWRMTVRKKMICPVPLARNPDIITMLQIEDDMTGGDGGWSAYPFAGPTLDWPSAVLNLLRFIRVLKGITQPKIDQPKETPKTETL